MYVSPFDMNLWYFVFYMEIYATSKKCDEFVVIHDIYMHYM